MSDPFPATEIEAQPDSNGFQERPTAQSDGAIDLLRVYFGLSGIANEEELCALCSKLDGPDFSKAKRYRLERAVARICLYPVAGQLPLYGAFPRNSPAFTRRTVPDRVPRPQSAIPQHLFTLNWADSAPGVSWPEAYYVTLLSDFRQYVVTASVDSTEVYDCLDLAIGHFDAECPLLEGVRRCIVDWWRMWESEGGQAAWAYLFIANLVSAQLAHAWREEVWPAESRSAEILIDGASS